MTGVRKVRLERAGPRRTEACGEPTSGPVAMLYCRLASLFLCRKESERTESVFLPLGRFAYINLMSENVMEMQCVHRFVTPVVQGVAVFIHSQL